jgi:hypothetical protein
MSSTLPVFSTRRSSGSFHRTLAVLLLTLVGSFAFSGCLTNGSSANQKAVLASPQSSLRAGSTLQLSATVQGVAATGGTWTVVGGSANGTVTSDGTYLAPSATPNPNQVAIDYTLNGVTSTLPITVLNPMPTVTSAAPNIVAASPTPIIVTGTGFVQGSVILVNSVAISTTLIDAGHLSGTIVPNAGASSIQITVANPAPGGATSGSTTIDQVSTSFTIAPAILSGGNVTLTLTASSNLPTGVVVMLDGSPMTTTSTSPTTITASGFLAPWKTGTVGVGIAATATSAAIDVQSVPIASTAVSFDVASRFSTQAAFGPRPDVVSHIQQIGLDAYITEQQNLPGVTYDPGYSGTTQFLSAAQTGNSLLRLRVAWALQSFMVSQGNFFHPSVMPYETLLERDCTGNFRQLMTDVSTDPSIGQFLNLAGNNMSWWDPTQHPNQNFAREFMQLFTLGASLLNDDGSMQLDTSGNPIPTYTQPEVADLSRVFTGWDIGGGNPLYTSLGVDYSQPLVPQDNWHDPGAKTILGQTFIPAGQGIISDRDVALDTIFQHPNLPPHVSRILIQRLVKSGPSPAYVQRISRVFENDGNGVRGNLSAVVRAILLDPEARSGDTSISKDDGFLQEPLLFQLFTTSITELPMSDDQPDYLAENLGENWWYSGTVFGYNSPSYMIPGTSINSPEFQNFTNQTSTVRSEYLWGFLTGTAAGYANNSTSWLGTNFKTAPALVDALNHLAYHGQMSSDEQAIIIAYCAQLSPQDWPTQFESAAFLALNGDAFTVAH